MGLPSPEYEVQVRGEDGGDAAFGESGRLWLRGIPGISMFHSYLDNPDATAAAFDEQGWFDTGDMVTATADGFITFNGRSGDILRVGAENVAESEIERVVAPCRACSKSRWSAGRMTCWTRSRSRLSKRRALLRGSQGGACQPDNRPSREQLADFKVPREVFVVEQIPRVTLGKLDKKTLRKQAARSIIQGVRACIPTCDPNRRRSTSAPWQ